MTELQEWYKNHESDYEAVKERLFSARQTLLYGSINHAAENLRLSYLNAVFSIQTQKERHEQAFTAYINGVSLRTAAERTVYPNQKSEWIEATFAKTDWVEVAKDVRSYLKDDDFIGLIQMQSDLTGVAYVKWSFALCMCGVWELACFDSNVSNHMRDGKRPNVNSAAEYYELIQDLQEHTGINDHMFIIQWCIYDYERGEHSRHMPFFRNICLQ